MKWFRGGLEVKAYRLSPCAQVSFVVGEIAKKEGIKIDAYTLHPEP